MHLKFIFFLLFVLASTQYSLAFLPLKTVPSDTDVVFRNWEKTIDGAIKEKEINKVIRLIFPEESAMGENTEYVYSHVRFVDFDVDGLTDMVYYGYTGGEGEMLIFFRKNEEDYTEILRAYGGLTEYSANKTGKPLAFSIFNYGCCASMTDYFYEYVPVYSNGKSTFSYVVKSKYGIFNQTEFPGNDEYLAEPVAFRIVSDKYTLRFNPVIDDTLYDGPNFLNTGNVVAYYGKGDIGTATASRMDSTGRIWWFVKMSANIKVKETELYESSIEYINQCRTEGIEPEACIVVGWMSSRYLEKME